MRHKVQYYETDMMSVTHHSNYIRWMEEARVDLMDRIGFPYSRMEAEGVLCVVKSLQVNFLKPCTFGDEVDIAVTVRDFNGVVVTLVHFISAILIRPLGKEKLKVILAKINFAYGYN